MKRRGFLKTSAVGAAVAVGAASDGRAAASASNKVTLAVMGVRGRGRNLINYFGQMPDVDLAYLCDVDQSVVEPAMKIAEEGQGKRPRLEEDIRRVLDDPGVDAIVVSTPIHWHAPATILACEAGKDVYVEKPISHNVREGRLMVDAAKKHNRIVQVGTQARSRPNTIQFVDDIRSGRIGKVHMAKVWNCQMRRNIGFKQDEPVPAGINYDLWTGPVPKLPFNRNRYNATVNWQWHYGAGDLGNDGIHWVDVARWILGVDYPTEVSGMGRKLYFDDDQQTPDTQVLTFNYEDKVLMYEQRLWNTYRMNGGQNGVEVYGTEGKAFVQFFDDLYQYGYKIFDKKGHEIQSELAGNRDDNPHYGNFIDCVRTRKTPNADIETGHISTALCHLGNTASRLNRTLRFDPASESFVDDLEANGYLTRDYRQHWSSRPFV
ncbi:MAG: Gfo/Idh/MocA family oxidoreductase [Fuerstiella sp.]|nr:Gfo/Idh/MocA family oxidoreductase [Fuerstiella sp.]